MATTGQILLVLQYRYANCNYKFEGLTYQDLEWYDTNTVKPTEVEIENLYTEVLAEFHSNVYIKLRQEQYPPVEDLIVALWEKLVETDGLTSNLIQQLQQKRVEVKNSIPKDIGTRQTNIL